MAYLFGRSLGLPSTIPQPLGGGVALHSTTLYLGAHQLPDRMTSTATFQMAMPCDGSALSHPLSASSGSVGGTSLFRDGHFLRHFPPGGGVGGARGQKTTSQIGNRQQPNTPVFAPSSPPDHAIELTALDLLPDPAMGETPAAQGIQPAAFSEQAVADELRGLFPEDIEYQVAKLLLTVRKLFEEDGKGDARVSLREVKRIRDYVALFGASESLPRALATALWLTLGAGLSAQELAGPLGKELCAQIEGICVPLPDGTSPSLDLRTVMGESLDASQRTRRSTDRKVRDGYEPIEVLENVMGYSRKAQQFLAGHLQALARILAAHDARMPPTPRLSADVHYDHRFPTSRRLLDQTIAALAINRFVLLSGEPASGKSEVGRYLATQLGWGYEVFNCHRYTAEEDMLQQIGIVAADETRFEITDGPLARALIEGKLFILNEINLAKPGNLAFLFKVLADVDTEFDYYDAKTGRTERRRIHPNFRLIATQNPEGPQRKELNAALRNRAIEIAAEPLHPLELTMLIKNRHPHLEAQYKGLPLTIVRLYQEIGQRLQARMMGAYGEGYAWNLRHLLRLAEGFAAHSGRLTRDAVLTIVSDAIGVSFRPEDQDSFFQAVRRFTYGNVGFGMEQVVHFRKKRRDLTMASVFSEFGIDPRMGAALLAEEGVRDVPTSARFLRSIFLSLTRTYHPWLKGPAGTGKTKLARLAARLLGAQVFGDTLTPQTDTAMLKGQLKPLIKERGIGFQLVPAPLVEALRASQRTEDLVVCILDESAFAKPDVLEELNSLLDRDGGIWVPGEDGQGMEFLRRGPGFRLLLASNTYGYGGVALQSEAFRSRMHEIWMGFEFGAKELASILGEIPLTSEISGTLVTQEVAQLLLAVRKLFIDHGLGEARVSLREVGRIRNYVRTFGPFQGNLRALVNALWLTLGTSLSLEERTGEVGKMLLSQIRAMQIPGVSAEAIDLFLRRMVEPKTMLDLPADYRGHLFETIFHADSLFHDMTEEAYYLLCAINGPLMDEAGLIDLIEQITSHAKVNPQAAQRILGTLAQEATFTPALWETFRDAVAGLDDDTSVEFAHIIHSMVQNPSLPKAFRDSLQAFSILRQNIEGHRTAGGQYLTLLREMLLHLPLSDEERIAVIDTITEYDPYSSTRPGCVWYWHLKEDVLLQYANRSHLSPRVGSHLVRSLQRLEQSRSASPMHGGKYQQNSFEIECLAMRFRSNRSWTYAEALRHIDGESKKERKAALIAAFLCDTSLSTVQRRALERRISEIAQKTNIPDVVLELLLSLPELDETVFQHLLTRQPQLNVRGKRSILVSAVSAPGLSAAKRAMLEDRLLTIGLDAYLEAVYRMRMDGIAPQRLAKIQERMWDLNAAFVRNSTETEQALTGTSDDAARITEISDQFTDLEVNVLLLAQTLATHDAAIDPEPILEVEPNYDYEIVRAHLLLNRLVQALTINRFVLLSGEPASGKSEVGRYLASQLGWRCEVFNCHRTTTEEEMMQRVGVQTHGGTRFRITDGPLARALIEGKLFILNEINLAQPGNLAFLFKVLADIDTEFDYYDASTGRTERRAIHPNFRMIATQNPEGPRRKSMNAALRNRAIEISAESYSALELEALLRSRHPSLEAHRPGLTANLVRLYVDIQRRVQSRTMGMNAEGYVWNLRHLIRMADGFAAHEGELKGQDALHILWQVVGVSLQSCDYESYFDAIRSYRYGGETRISREDIEAFQRAASQARFPDAVAQAGIDPVWAGRLAQEEGLIDIPTSAWFLQAVLLSLREGYHPWLKGPAGTGKTRLARFAARLLGAQLFDDTLTPQTDDGKLKGDLKPVMREGTIGFQHVPSALVKALRASRQTDGMVVCMLDEAAFARPDVLEELNSLLDRDGGIWVQREDGEEMEFLQSGKGFRLIMASNTYGYGGVNLQSEAFRSRAHEIFMEFSYGQEEVGQMLTGPGLATEGLAGSLAKTLLAARQLFIQHKKDHAGVSLREVMRLRAFLQTYGPMLGMSRAAGAGLWLILMASLSEADQHTELGRGLKASLRLLPLEEEDVALSAKPLGPRGIDHRLARLQQLKGQEMQGTSRQAPSSPEHEVLEEHLMILAEKLFGFRERDDALMEPRPESYYDVSLPTARKLLGRLAQALVINRFALLSGPPAAGKSEVGRYLASLLGWQCEVFNCHRYTSEEEMMQRVGVTTNGETRFQIADGPLARALIEGKLFIFNEINLAQPGSLAFLFKILADVDTEFDYYDARTGRTERRPIHPNFRMVATQNPTGPKRKDMNAALRNRAVEIAAHALNAMELAALLNRRHPRLEERHPGIVQSIVRLHADIKQRIDTGMLGGSYAEGNVWNLRHLMRLADAFAAHEGELTAQAVLRIGFESVGVSFLPHDRTAFLNALRSYVYGGVSITEEDLQAFHEHRDQLPLASAFMAAGIDAELAQGMSVSEGIIDIATSARFLQSVVASLRAGNHPWLKGPAGTGKTRLARFAARLLDAELYDDTLTPQTDDGKLKGELKPLTRGTRLGFQHVPAPLVNALRASQRTDGLIICLLDEGAFARPDVLEELNSLLDRDGGIWVQREDGEGLEFLRRGPGFRLIVASNTYGYAGVSLQSEAFRSRMHEIYMGFEYTLSELGILLAR